MANHHARHTHRNTIYFSTFLIISQLYSVPYIELTLFIKIKSSYLLRLELFMRIHPLVYISIELSYHPESG